MLVILFLLSIAKVNSITNHSNRLFLSGDRHNLFSIKSGLIVTKKFQKTSRHFNENVKAFFNFLKAYFLHPKKA